MFLSKKKVLKLLKNKIQTYKKNKNIYNKKNKKNNSFRRNKRKVNLQFKSLKRNKYYKKTKGGAPNEFKKFNEVLKNSNSIDINQAITDITQAITDINTLLEEKNETIKTMEKEFQQESEQYRAEIKKLSDDLTTDTEHEYEINNFIKQKNKNFRKIEAEHDTIVQQITDDIVKGKTLILELNAAKRNAEKKDTEGEEVYIKNTNPEKIKLEDVDSSSSEEEQITQMPYIFYQIDKLEEEKNKLYKQNTINEKNIEKITEEFNNNKKILEESIQKIKDYTDERNYIEERTNKQDKEIQNLRSELESTNKSNKDKEDLITNFKNNIEGKDITIKKLDEEVKILIESNEKASNNFVDEKKEFEKSKLEFEQKIAEIKKLKEDNDTNIEKLTNKLKETGESNTELTKELALQKTKDELFELEKKNLNAMIDRLDLEINNVQQLNEKLTLETKNLSKNLTESLNIQESLDAELESNNKETNEGKDKILKLQNIVKNLNTTLQQSVTDLKLQEAKFQNQLTQANKTRTELETQNKKNEKIIIELTEDLKNKDIDHNAMIEKLTQKVEEFKEETERLKNEEILKLTTIYKNSENDLKDSNKALEITKATLENKLQIAKDKIDELTEELAKRPQNVDNENGNSEKSLQDEFDEINLNSVKSEIKELTMLQSLIPKSKTEIQNSIEEDYINANPNEKENIRTDLSKKIKQVKKKTS